MHYATPPCHSGLLSHIQAKVSVCLDRLIEGKMLVEHIPLEPQVLPQQESQMLHVASELIDVSHTYALCISLCQGTVCYDTGFIVVDAVTQLHKTAQHAAGSV